MQIIGHFSGEHADLVVCDGAPDGERYHHIIMRHSLCVCVACRSFNLLIVFIVAIKNSNNQRFIK